MTRIVAALVLVVATTRVARADDRIDPPPIMDHIRELYRRGDYEGVRRELLKAYEIEPQPALLFALGQVELNLGHYQAAIDYYEKFIATNPSEDQAALAQQAIGAARIKLSQPPSPPPPPPAPVKHHPPRQWYTEDTGLVAFGGAAVAVGSGLVIYSATLGNDHSGSLSDFDQRLELARTTRWTGLGVAAAGALVVGVTVLRWRLRPDGGVITAQIAPGGVGVMARW